ncbi:hypothetical protein GGI15_004457 [Coemansia interrupta]|uniref:Uncharacterized protein n=1 Tax=Coemansia interrupta TaxID=1126814 RepID=A0A9W8LFD5_9FUNG|nr:hypothetical protein GGI15_004457 [Coemansia interrupta]
MVNRTSQTARQLALKAKLKPKSSPLAKVNKAATPSNASKAKKPRSAAAQAGRQIKSPFSTKHNAGRKDLCKSLDQALIADGGVSEALRGVGRPPAMTSDEKLRLVREQREHKAADYEQYQTAVTQTVDDLAQLMSNTN